MSEYYIIHIPIESEKSFVYRSILPLQEGCRVVVSFNRKELIGISGAIDPDAPDPKIRYKDIIEIIDHKPVLPLELMNLGVWIASYYQCSVAKALFAMLPGIMQPAISNSVRWIGEDSAYPPEMESLYEILKDQAWHPLQQVRKDGLIKAFYRLLEDAETQGWIEVKRDYRHKIKAKTANYIEVLDTNIKDLHLTSKQEQAFVLIKSSSLPCPLASLSQEISYAIIKALVKKGLIKIYPKQVQSKTLLLPERIEKKEIVLTTEQEDVLAELLLDFNRFGKHLLFGITGSGKTEIYIALIKRYLEIGKGVIFLIPEIALTPQMVERFFSAFGENLAIMHSQLTDRERYEEWKKIAENRCRIVIGARSAIFVPLSNIGLIIVDEEHEQSYKQDQAPRYNGRDLAVVRAQNCNAQVILGSATPSLESWQNVQVNKYLLHTLKKRPLSYLLPEVELINMRNEESRDLISSYLRDTISIALEQKQQVILFQNRRGFSSFVQCLKCGELIKCVNCEISMYYHRDREELNCHYCGNVIPVPRRCNKCGSYSFSYGAAGTQKIEQLLQVYFPMAKILRLDSDSASKKDMYRYMYEQMKKRDVDILLGTQMISKGLDFPGVTLVGVISADISLNVPDFRAAERTFQLLTQVAGRSGRGEKHGRVLIQSFNVDHYAIKHASHQDFESFATEELSYRKRLHYPPFYRLGRMVFQAKDPQVLNLLMEQLQKLCDDIAQSFPPPDLYILGPAPAPNAKINSMYRQHLVLKAHTPQILSVVILKFRNSLQIPSSVALSIDIDPLMLM